MTWPRVVVRHDPPGSRQASCTPVAWRPWIASIRPPAVTATRWLLPEYVGSLEPVNGSAIWLNPSIGSEMTVAVAADVAVVAPAVFVAVT